MEAAPTSIVSPVGTPAPRGGGYRGRGGLPMRGGYERGGRGRGMGRGHYMGGGLGRGGGLAGMGGGPPQGMMPGGRGMGMRPPRGAGYQGRGGYIPRGGPPMRGGRPPMYVQPPKQHTGAENNKTVSPLPAAGGNVAATSESDTASPTATANNAVNVAVSTVANAAPVAVNSNGTSVGGQTAPPQMRGPPRGRGGSYPRGRGSYNIHTNGMHGMGVSMGMEHGQMPMRRGGPPRGRGGYGQTMTRAPMHHSANTQIAPVPTLKRGAPTGPPGPKRGRYEGGPYSQRPMVPKYHQAPQHVSAMAPQSSYGAPPNHHQQQSHHGYASHDQSQTIDPYAQSYAATTAQSYNGYGQSTGYATHAAPPQQASSTYATHGSEYDQSQYQSYNSAAYGTQQDTRYQTYGQDYTQQYGAPAVDYNSTVQADYSQHGQQSYDERAYAGYDVLWALPNSMHMGTVVELPESLYRSVNDGRKIHILTSRATQMQQPDITK